ncbi:MAG: PaaI family thioesterase [Oscillospiraceae bacterium]|jgi:acyl-CoA thioesterase|nr:PaaI family thioesterase [Oscillospiraceae bacterium]
MKTIGQLYDFFKEDKFAMGIGAVIEEVDENSALISVKLTPEHMNGLGVPQGGLVYTIADFAFAVASNAHENSPDYVTLQSSMNFIRSSRGEKLFARATAVHKGRTVAVYNATVYDDLGKTVASASFTGFATKQV